MANRQDFERRLHARRIDWHRHTELMDRTYRWGMAEVARLRAEGCAVVGGA